MKTWWAVIFGVVCGLLGAGGILLASSPPRGRAIQLLPPPTPAPIQVHISGEVNKPGVYGLPTGGRVQDAIEAAGGFSEDANQPMLNLAAILEDGMQIWVPAIPSMDNPAGPATNSDRAAPSIDLSPAENPAQIININTATQAELETLSGIGPVTAKKIIEHRQTNGLFIGIEDIQKVSGIGPATFEKIKDCITVGGLP